MACNGMKTGGFLDEQLLYYNFKQYHVLTDMKHDMSLKYTFLIKIIW